MFIHSRKRKEDPRHPEYVMVQFFLLVPLGIKGLTTVGETRVAPFSRTTSGNPSMPLVAYGSPLLITPTYSSRTNALGAHGPFCTFANHWRSCEARVARKLRGFPVKVTPYQRMRIH